MQQIENIRTKLNQLKTLDKRFSIFGSSRHKYVLYEKPSKEELDQLEKEHDIVLAEDYKTFLQELGNGGPGSGYGLEKLSLKYITPPYIGTKHLLRNCKDPSEMEHDMVELDEISGYIKLFDYGCGMETGLIVNGEEAGEMIYFDCDGGFRKLENNSFLDIYETWLDDSLADLNRVKLKLMEDPVSVVIEDEWESENYFIKEMISSILDFDVPNHQHDSAEYKLHMEGMRLAWLKQFQENKTIELSASKKWWQFWKD